MSLRDQIDLFSWRLDRYRCRGSYAVINCVFVTSNTVRLEDASRQGTTSISRSAPWPVFFRRPTPLPNAPVAIETQGIVRHPAIVKQCIVTSRWSQRESSQSEYVKYVYLSSLASVPQSCRPRLYGVVELWSRSRCTGSSRVDGYQGHVSTIRHVRSRNYARSPSTYEAPECLMMK